MGLFCFTAEFRDGWCERRKPAALLTAFAAFLKKSGRLNVPEWADTVKTAVFKELSPYDRDWYYVRCASTMRHLYIRGRAGVKSFQKIYGGRKRRGTKPAHFCPSSKSVARKVFQSLEKMGLLEQDESGFRRVTAQGQRDLDRIAGQMASQKA